MEPTSNVWWMAATIVLAFVACGLGAVLLMSRSSGRSPSKPMQSKEAEYAAATRKLLQVLSPNARMDPLAWLREEAPSQLTALSASARAGKQMMSKLGIAGPEHVESSLNDLMDGENVHRALWKRLSRSVGLPEQEDPNEMAKALNRRFKEMQNEIEDDRNFMLGVAVKAGVTASREKPQEALNWGLINLQKRVQSAEYEVKQLAPAAKTLEELKPTVALALQLKQSLHKARPAIADREVFAILGYLLNYSLATMQGAILNGDENLRLAMLHNIKTISGALSEYEDSFAKVHARLRGTPEPELATERHDDHSDFLSLLQKALDLRNLRLSPFAIATDAQGRAYCVTTAVA